MTERAPTRPPTAEAAHLAAGAAAAGPERPAPDTLAVIDELLGALAERRHQAADDDARRSAEVDAAGLELSAVFDRVVRPPMEAAVSRLRANGGDGVVVERREDLTLDRTHRLTLWMSLDGELDATPREDRNPYLQLDADKSTDSATVAEGDMWRGQGGSRSGHVGGWPVREITQERVRVEIVDILRRAVT